MRFISARQLDKCRICKSQSPKSLFPTLEFSSGGEYDKTITTVDSLWPFELKERMLISAEKNAQHIKIWIPAVIKIFRGASPKISLNRAQEMGQSYHYPYNGSCKHFLFSDNFTTFSL